MKISFYLSVIAVMLFSGCSTQSFKMFDGNNTVVKTVSDKEYMQETQFEWKIAKDDRVEISIVNQTILPQKNQTAISKV